MDLFNYRDYLKYRDWRYQIMLLNGRELYNEIEKLTRNDIIEWLQWNDSNGIYNDRDSLRETGSILSTEEGKEIMARLIEDSR